MINRARSIRQSRESVVDSTRLVVLCEASLDAQLLRDNVVELMRLCRVKDMQIVQDPSALSKVCQVCACMCVRETKRKRDLGKGEKVQMNATHAPIPANW